MYNSYGFLPPPGKMHFTWNRPWRIQVMLLQCNYEMYHVWLWQTQFRSYTSRERGGHVVERKQGRVSKHGRESEQAEKDIKRDEEMPQIKRVKWIESDRVFIQVRLTWKIEWKLQHSFCCCHRMRNIVPAKKKAVVKYDGKAWNWQYHWNSHDCNEHFNPILIFNNIPKITKVNFDSYQKKTTLTGWHCVYIAKNRFRHKHLQQKPCCRCWKTLMGEKSLPISNLCCYVLWPLALIFTDSIVNCTRRVITSLKHDLSLVQYTARILCVPLIIAKKTWPRKWMGNSLRMCDI